MTITHFPGQNGALTSPTSDTVIPVLRVEALGGKADGLSLVYAAWKPDDQDRARIAAGGFVYVLTQVKHMHMVLRTELATQTAARPTKKTIKAK
jgi:hypothetical protein